MFGTNNTIAPIYISEVLKKSRLHYAYLRPRNFSAPNGVHPIQRLTWGDW